MKKNLKIKESQKIEKTRGRKETWARLALISLIGLIYIALSKRDPLIILAPLLLFLFSLYKYFKLKK